MLHDLQLDCNSTLQLVLSPLLLLLKKHVPGKIVLFDPVFDILIDIMVARVTY